MKNLINSIFALAFFVAVSFFVNLLDVVFCVNNNYLGPLGNITINTAQGPSTLFVPGPGAFSRPIPANTDNVVINNYVIFHGQSGTAKLATGAWVKVDWASTNAVIVNPVENN